MSKIGLAQQLELQQNQLLEEAKIAPKTESRPKKRKIKYTDRVEKETSGLAIDDPIFNVHRKSVCLIAAYLATEVQEIRTQTRGLQDDEVEAILRRCAQYTELAMSWQLLSLIIWGPAGDGKSTILKCLLNESNAAIASGGAQSCTNVKHQYFHTEQLQDGQYRAVVEFASETTLRSTVEHHVEKILAYQRFLSSDKDEEEYQLAQNMDEAERDASLDILAGLTVRPEANLSFKSRTELKAFLEDEDRKETSTKRTVVDYAIATLEDYAGGGGQREIEAKSLTELLDACHEFSRPVEDQDLAPWMLVKQISIWIPAFVLENSISLADVPGIFDTHPIRRQAANDSFESCSTVILVHKYQRAADSTLMDESLKLCVSANKNVIVVLTHIETAAKAGRDCWGESEIKDKETFGGEELKDDVLQQLVSELRETKRELEAAEDEEHEDDSEGDSEDDVVAQRVDVLKAECLKLDARIYKRRLVVKRALMIVETLQEKHRGLQLSLNGLVDKKLSVHCTCGPEYERYMKGYQLSQAPDLSVEETGVPALRNEVRSLRADMMIRDLEDAVNHNGLERVLNAFDFYCDHSKLDLKDLIKDHLIKPKESFTSQCDELSEQLDNEIQISMDHGETTAIQISKNQGKTLHKKWAELHHATYRLFCEKYGEHRQRIDGNIMRTSWNKEIAAELENIIITTFRDILQKIRDRKTKLLERVDSFLDDIVVELKGKGQYPYRRV